MIESSRNGARGRLSKKERALQEIGTMILTGRPSPRRERPFWRRYCAGRGRNVRLSLGGKFTGSNGASSSSRSRAARPCPELIRGFPVTQGISQREAVEKRRSVVKVKDVRKEQAFFLPNFWTTRSEIIVPII